MFVTVNCEEQGLLSMNRACVARGPLWLCSPSFSEASEMSWLNQPYQGGYGQQQPQGYGLQPQMTGYVPQQPLQVST